MRKLEGFKHPERWEDISIKQFSDYNKALAKYTNVKKAFEDEEKEMSEIKALHIEGEMYGKIMSAFAGISVEEVNELPFGVVKYYADSLDFIYEEYKPKGLKKFTHNDIEYKFPEDVRLDTKFGQYVNSLQAEAVAVAVDPNDIEFVAMQIAHMVSDGRGWSEERRDKLAKEFLDLPSTLAFEFAFFLTEKCEIYSKALLQYQVKELRKKLPFTKRILLVMGGLKRFMKSLRLGSLINLIRLRLTVLKIHLQERFLCI